MNGLCVCVCLHSSEEEKKMHNKINLLCNGYVTVKQLNLMTSKYETHKIIIIIF